MMRLLPTAAIGCLLLLAGTGQCISCDANITISSASDASEVRKACKTINGDLEFVKGFNESVSFDGVEAIGGKLRHYGCMPRTDFDCPVPSSFSVSFPTLKELGSASINYFHALQNFSLPNLETVHGELNMYSVDQLKVLDITKLSRFESTVIDAPNLTMLKHGKLESLIGESGTVAIWAMGIDSVDSFFSSPIKRSRNGSASDVKFDGPDLPNVKHFTFGWSELDTLTIDGGLQSVDVTLGASNTTSMDITSLKVSGNVTELKRGASVQNVTIGNFTLTESAVTHLNLSVIDELAVLDLSMNRDLKTMENSPNAMSWKNFSISIEGSPNLTLTSQYRNNSDGSNDQIWYWPQYNISSIYINDTNVSIEFFETFFTQFTKDADAPKVLKSFFIMPTTDVVLNCTPFDELREQGVLLGEYSCTNMTWHTSLHLKESRGSVTAVGVWPLVMGSAILILDNVVGLF